MDASSRQPFPKYLPGADHEYLQSDDWTERRSWLQERDARLLSVADSNRLDIGSRVDIVAERVQTNRRQIILYSSYPRRGVHTLKLPYEVFEQHERLVPGTDTSYQQLVENYVAANLGETKYLCTLDPQRCCVVQHSTFSYALLGTIELGHMATPIALFDDARDHLVLFDYDWPLQRICSVNEIELDGHARSWWNDRYLEYFGELRKVRGDDAHLVKQLAARYLDQ